MDEHGRKESSRGKMFLLSLTCKDPGCECKEMQNSLQDLQSQSEAELRTGALRSTTCVCEGDEATMMVKHGLFHRHM